ncbi:hypothetical protein [Haloarcula halophila]|uniref:hypothetical protein n=1 Tax=Haloarcula TaxID=2237 RepID=UPI0023E4722B|nr:hypothetical protein [Halomicroarcula sp. DFY41]
MMSVSTYKFFNGGVSLLLFSFAVLGFGLVSVPLLLFLKEQANVTEITIRDKEYSIGAHSGEQDTDNELDKIENIRPLLEEISEHIRIQEQKYEEVQYDTHIQFVMNELSRQLAINEYTQSAGESHDLRVVRYRNNRVTAHAEKELDLPKGLEFLILSDDDENSNVNGRIGKAELVENNSTDGDLFEFEVLEWKSDDQDWQIDAQSDLSQGHARMRVINHDVIDMDTSKLEIAIECLEKMKRQSEVEYGT